MWLFTDYGYFSITQKPHRPDVLCVRTRLPGDGEAFRERLAAVTGKTVEEVAAAYPIEDGTGTDYRFRMWVPHADVAAVLHDYTLNLNFGNFKGRVSQTQGHERGSLYMQVWNIMNRAQEKAARMSQRFTQNNLF